MDLDQTSETTLRDYLRVLFRHKTVIAVTILTVCATVFTGLKLKTEVYESSVKMLITAEKQVESTYLKEMYSGRNVQQTLTQSEIVKSNPVLNRVVRSLALDKRPLDDEKKSSSPLKARLIDYNTRAFSKKLESVPAGQRDAFFFRRAVESLKNSINVEPIRDTNMFTISVRDYNPVAAALIANVVSRSYVMFDLEQQLAELKLKYGTKHPTVNLIEDSIAALNKTLDGRPLDDIEAMGPASVKIMEQANAAMEPTGTSQTLTFMLAVVMSVFLAVMLAFVFEYTDQTFKTPRDIARFLKVPFLGSVARTRFSGNKLIKDAREKSGYFQSYRGLSDQICLLFKSENLRSFLITSATANEGSAKIVANTGYYLARILQHRVLIIDANLRTSSMSRLLKHTAPQEKGLAAYLEDRASIDEIVQDYGVGPDVITGGATNKNPATLLGSEKMGQLLKTAAREYDIVLIDCANVQDYKDAAVLSALADGLALTVNEGATRRQVVQNACAQLQEHNAKIKGVILNNRTFPIPGIIYSRV